MAGKKSPSIFSTLQKTTENASAVNGELTRQLPVASLVDNPLNRFSMAEDDEFLSTMRSVEQDGFLEDIVVTPDGENTWRIISGHRRVMAARKLGKTAVPCKVRRYPDKLSELRALMGANVHRRSLSPFDMARQLETLREVLSESRQLPEGTKEQAELMAAQSDLSRATVERYLDLLNLDETMTGWAERGEMTMTDAYEMARRKNVHLQAAVEEYVAHNNANGDFPGLVHRAMAHHQRTPPGDGRRAAPASAQARPGRQSSADGGFLWPGRPPLHRPAEGAGSLRRRGPHHRPEKAGHLPCQSGRTAANGGGPESRSGRLISPLPRTVRAAQNAYAAL